MNEGVEWGTVAQWVGLLVPIALALFAIKRTQNKEALDALSRKIDDGLSALRESSKAGHVEIRNDIAALRIDDGRAFERIDHGEARMAAMEIEMKHLVTKEELHLLDNRLARLDEKMSAGFEKIGDKITMLYQQNQRAEERAIEAESRR